MEYAKDFLSYDQQVEKLKNEKICKLMMRHITKPTDYHYINHAQRKYGNVPLWVLTNALTFGNISKMYMLQRISGMTR
ncbi:MAG: Abi family protein [Lachnospiraceae bacterium]|nr:Abi family protein [Lachnospiraceae bacterium]